jgi:hypothetical protein
VLAGEAAMGWLDRGTPLREYGRQLAERHLTHERLVPGLPQLYRILRHASRDLVPFVRARSPISAACFAQGEFEFTARDRGVIAGAEPIAVAAARARERARRLVYRERPFFGAVVSEIERGAAARSHSAEALYVARSVFPAFDVGCAGLRRAAVCAELAWMAAALFGGLDADLEEPTPQGSKGSGWMAASLAFDLGDRLLARCFALSAAIPKPSAGIVAEALVRAFERLSERALRGAQLEGNVATHVIAAEAARAGALLGGGSRASADQLSETAIGVISYVAADQLLPVYLGRTRGDRSRRGAPL